MRSNSMLFLRYRSPSTRRAWIEISTRSESVPAVVRSPSTRRAWIEIKYTPLEQASPQSPSTRRAWIEIRVSLRIQLRSFVALHPEGVDRNS